MKANEYRLTPSATVLGHVAPPVWLLQDADNQSLDMQALAASGDCFAALATMVDAISDELTEDDAAASRTKPRLEQLANGLLYLQRHYDIRRKAADYRQ